jgi:hypothetical protein
MAAQSHFNIEDSARRWQVLAERRLLSYIELYRSGRWQRYYRSREEFAARMLDVIKVAKTFKEMAGVPATVTAPWVIDEPLRSAA